MQSQPTSLPTKALPKSSSLPQKRGASPFLAVLVVFAGCGLVRGAEYELVWADEFNETGRPDAANWTYETGFVRNEELQWYQQENARCEDGMLIIEARRERVPNPDYRAGSRSWRRSRSHAEYTSACLTTKGLHQWKYGRFVMRGRIDTRPGIWPARRRPTEPSI